MIRRQTLKELYRYGARRADNVSLRLRSLVRPPLQRRVFFMHLEKCGGTSVSRTLRRLYLNWRIDDCKRIIHLDHEASLAAASAQALPMFAYREQLLYYLLAQEDAAFVTGHFQVSRPLVETFRDEWIFLIMLREPVRRWISHYFFNRFKADPHGRLHTSLEAYLDTPRAASLGQDYVRLLTGRGVYGTPEHPETPPPEVVEQAKHALDRFHVVGCLEDLGGFIAQVEGVLGTSLNMGHENKNPAPPSRRAEAVTPALRKQIRALCAPNIEMYRHALHPSS